MTSYAVRISAQANRDIVEASTWLTGLIDEALVLQWSEGLLSEIGALSGAARQSAISERESRLFGGEIKRLIYRRTEASTAAYHIFYRVEETGQDGPIVRVLHVRHTTRRPLTADEAHEILTSD